MAKAVAIVITGIAIAVRALNLEGFFAVEVISSFDST